MREWKTEVRKLSELKPYHKNPRKLTAKQSEDIQKSIEKFGLTDKPLVQPDGTIIGGHARVKVLKKMGHKEIPVLVAEPALDDKEIEEAVIRHNKNTGEWDFDILANEWEMNDLIDWGFEEKDLLDIVESIDDANEEDEQTLEPAKDEDAITNLGDIYELNEHRLVCGDSTLPEYVEKCLNGFVPEMVYTDPPYGIAVKICNGEKHSNRTCRRNKFNPIINDESNQTAIQAFKLCVGLEIPVMIWWGANYYSSAIPDSSCWIVWDKDNGDSDFADCELAWCNQKSAARIFKHRWAGWVKDSEKGERRVHPTQKPIALAEWCIDKYGKECQSVYDLFVGSGSTLIACEKKTKKFYGIELSPAYCDIIVERWKNYMIKNNRPYTIKRNGELIGS